MDEKNVIKRCQGGDKSAFNGLIRHFYPYVSKFLLKLTCNEALSEDLTQETFLKIIRSIEKYNLYGKAGFGTYLMTVARNTCIPHQKITTDTTEFKYYEIDNKGRMVNKKLYLDPFFDMFNGGVLSYGISQNPSAISVLTAQHLGCIKIA